MLLYYLQLTLVVRQVGSLQSWRRCTCDERALAHELATSKDADLNFGAVWLRPQDTHFAIADDKEIGAGLTMTHERLTILHRSSGHMGQQ